MLPLFLLKSTWIVPTRQINKQSSSDGWFPPGAIRTSAVVGQEKFLREILPYKTRRIVKFNKTNIFSVLSRSETHKGNHSTA